MGVTGGARLVLRFHSGASPESIERALTVTKARVQRATQLVPEEVEVSVPFEDVCVLKRDLEVFGVNDVADLVDPCVRAAGDEEERPATVVVDPRTLFLARAPASWDMADIYEIFRTLQAWG